MRSRRTLSQVTCLIFSSLAAGACPPPTNNGETSGESSTQAQTSDGSTTAACIVGSEGCPCTGGGGCDPGLVCSPMKVCVDEGGTTTEEPGTSTTMDVPGSTGTTGDASTGEPSVCDPGNGQPNIDCMAINADEPYCADAGVCGGCTVLPPDGCGAIDPGKPLCNPDDGQCVACTVDDDALCGGDKPACNPDTNACEGCFLHSHCPDSACDLVARKCFPTDRVLHVRLGLPGDPNNLCTDKIPTGGSPENPYCFADYAILHAQKDGLTSGWTIKFLKTSWDQFYHPAITIPGDGSDIRYAFIHEPAAYIGDRHMTLRDVVPMFNGGIGVTLYIDNFLMEMMDPPSDLAGVVCQQGGRMFLDNSYVIGARGPGVKATGCELWVRNSTVTDGWTEGVDVTDGKLHMVNSYVTDNRFFKDKRGGGIAATNSSLDIVYSSILNNNNEAMSGGDSIHCRDDKVVGVIRNSVIGRTPMGLNPSILCDPNDVKVVTSVVDSDEFKEGNLKLAGETILGLFDVDLNIGAYKIKNPKTFPAGVETLRNAAIWQKGDPRVDFDGEARNTKAGQPDFAGADVYPLP